jgi:hypothetical protein
MTNRGDMGQAPERKVHRSQNVSLNRRQNWPSATATLMAPPTIKSAILGRKVYWLRESLGPPASRFCKSS